MGPRNQESAGQKWLRLSVPGHVLQHSLDVMVMGGRRPGLDGRAHCTEMTLDPGTQNTVGHERGGRGRGNGTRAQSHLKGRRGVQLKLLIRELRKATRSETKGAR